MQYASADKLCIRDVMGNGNDRFPADVAYHFGCFYPVFAVNAPERLVHKQYTAAAAHGTDNGCPALHSS